jgi:hypothetical protein
VKGGTRRLLHRNGEENRGSARGHHVERRMEEGGGSGAGSATWRKEENGARRLGSYTRAMERGAGRAVSSAVRKQGSRRRAWAACECVGRPGEGMNWAGPERTMPFCN